MKHHDEDREVEESADTYIISEDDQADAYRDHDPDAVDPVIEEVLAVHDPDGLPGDVTVYSDTDLIDVESAEVEVFDAFPADVDMPLSGVMEIRRGIMAMDDQRQALVEAGDVDNLALGSADLALVIDDLQTVQRAVRRDVAQLMLAGHVDEEGKRKRGNPKREVAGLGVIDVPGGSEWRGWESERLLRDLITLALIEPDGSYRSFDHPRDVADSVYETLVACLPATASLQWRVGSIDKATEQPTALKAAGIDPNDYAERIDKERLAKIPAKPKAAS